MDFFLNIFLVNYYHIHNLIINMAYGFRIWVYLLIIVTTHHIKVKTFFASSLFVFIKILFVLPTGKKTTLKTFNEIQTLLSQGKKREVKLIIRENSWPINSTIRSQLWPALCSQHQVGKSMLDGFYWDMVNQVCKLSNLATFSNNNLSFCRCLVRQNFQKNQSCCHRLWIQHIAFLII